MHYGQFENSELQVLSKAGGTPGDFIRRSRRSTCFKIADIWHVIYIYSPAFAKSFSETQGQIVGAVPLDLRGRR